MLTENSVQNLLPSGFLPNISLPTRVTTTIATLLDNIFFSAHSFRVVKSSVVLTNTPDHFLVTAFFYFAQNSPDRHKPSEKNKGRQK